MSLHVFANGFNSNNDVKYAMFNVVDEVLAEMAWYSRAPTIDEAEMCSFVQTNLGAVKIVRLELFNMSFLVLIADTLVNVVERVVNEYLLDDMEKATTKFAGAKPWIERSPRHPTGPSRISSHYKSPEEPAVAGVVAVALCTATAAKRKYGMDAIPYLKPSVRIVPIVGTSIITRCTGTSYLTNQSVPIIEQFNAFYQEALDYLSCGLSNRS